MTLEESKKNIKCLFRISASPLDTLCSVAGIFIDFLNNTMMPSAGQLCIQLLLVEVIDLYKLFIRGTC